MTLFLALIAACGAPATEALTIDVAMRGATLADLLTYEADRTGVPTVGPACLADVKVVHEANGRPIDSVDALSALQTEAQKTRTGTVKLDVIRRGLSQTITYMVR